MRSRPSGVPRVLFLIGACGLIGGCGGGSVTLPKQDQVATATPTPTPTPSPTPSATASDPQIKGGAVTPIAGVAPLLVGYDLCGSRDGRGGQDLTYTADFADNAGAVAQEGCGFQHRFGSDGVSVYRTQLCVIDRQTMKSACEPSDIKAYVSSKVDWTFRSCGPPTVDATAALSLRPFQGDVAALSSVDDVVFEAYKADDLRVRVAGPTKGSKQDALNWKLANWVVTSSKVRVFATIYSRNVAGDDRPYVDVNTGCP